MRLKCIPGDVWQRMRWPAATASFDHFLQKKQMCRTRSIRESVETMFCLWSGRSAPSPLFALTCPSPLLFQYIRSSKNPQPASHCHHSTPRAHIFAFVLAPLEINRSARFVRQGRPVMLNKRSQVSFHSYRRRRRGNAPAGVKYHVLARLAGSLTKQ